MTLLIALSVVSGFIVERRSGLRGRFAQGLLFGCASVIGMLRPLEIEPGLFFDGRSVLISICGLFFGPLAVNVAAAIAIAVRLWMGGIGSTMGVSIIVSSAIIGLLFHQRRIRRTGDIRSAELFMFGLLVHGAMLALSVTLPTGYPLQILREIGVPIMVTFPLATVLIGKIITDQQARTRYVQSLWAAKEEFRTTLYSIGDAVITTDSTGHVRHVNPVAERLIGWRETEALGKPLDAVFRTVDETTGVPRVSPLRRALSDQRSSGLPFQTRLIARDAISCPIAESGAPIRDADGRITGVVLVFRDQTNDRARDAALRESELIFSEFMANSPIYVFFKDEQIRSIRLSANFQHMLGRPVAEMLGKTMEELFPSELARSMVADDERVLREGKPLTADEELDGRQYTTIKFPISVHGKPRYLAGFTIDVTERKATEAALTRRIAYERAAASCMRLLLDLTDTHARLQDVVTLLVNCVGASRAYVFHNDVDPEAGLCMSQTHEAVAQGIASQLHNPILQRLPYRTGAPNMLSRLDSRCHFTGIVHCLPEPERSILETQEVCSVLILPIFAGQHFWGFLGFDDCVCERHWAEDDIRLLQVVADGIGAAALRMQAELDREQLETQLQHSRKMEAIGRLAGGVAHDFNNMLNVILGHAELAKDRLAPRDPIYEHVDEIAKAGARSADLTRQLLAFARKQTIAPRTVALNTTIAGMLKMLTRLIGEHIDLVWRPAEALWNVRFDPAQVDQILVNLVVNARDALDAGGTIIIETGNANFDESWCDIHPDYERGEFVVLRVRDDGCGMDEDTLTKLFEPFFTTKELGKGTGLGLATVYGIVKQNQGFIQVSSEPGVGTSVQLYLPRYDEVLPQSNDTRSDGACLTGSETILLLEDEPALLDLGNRFLTKLGYTVIPASSPSQAIRLFNDAQAPIDLLITDVVMPEMSGRDVWERLSASAPELRCLYVSGYTADAIADSGLLGADVHFLPKPFSVETLASKVREVIER